MRLLTPFDFVPGYPLQRRCRGSGGDAIASSDHRRIRRALVAASDARVRADVSMALRTRSVAVTEARTLHEAIALLSISPDIVIFEPHLSGAGCFDLLDAANERLPTPVRIAIGAHLAAEEAFELAHRGVTRLLAPPITMRVVQQALDQAEEIDSYRFLVPDVVGVHSVHAVQIAIREIMTRQALALARGNRGQAARLLGISRQAMHQMIRRPVPMDHEKPDPPHTVTSREGRPPQCAEVPREPRRAQAPRASTPCDGYSDSKDPAGQTPRHHGRVPAQRTLPAS